MVRNSNDILTTKGKIMIDKKDLEILRILEDNARTPYTKIAEMLNLSEAAIRKRVKKLEELGLIEGYSAKINYKLLGMKIALIGLDIESEYMIKILEKLKSFDNKIKSIYVSMGDHDIMVEIIYKDSRELHNIIKNLEAIDGVIRVCPAILVEKIK